MKDVWKEIQYKGKTYRAVFNLNTMERFQEEYGSIQAWGELVQAEECNIKALIFGFTEMINEGIDIQNDENGTKEPFLTTKQVGRMISELGFTTVAKDVNQLVVDSTKSEEKNE